MRQAEQQGSQGNESITETLINWKRENGEAGNLVLFLFLSGYRARIRPSMGGIRKMWPWFLALLSGAMLAMCYAPFDSPAMVWLGLVPLLVSVWAGGGKRRKWFGFTTGYLAGLSFWLINLKWLSEVGDMGWYASRFSWRSILPSGGSLRRERGTRGCPG